MSRLFGGLAAIGLLAGAFCSRALADPPPVRGELPDLAEFRTVNQAVTTTISRAAPKLAPQPAYLGIHLESHGKDQLHIAVVAAESPAARAGLRKGDILRVADGQPLADLNAFRALLETKAPGDELHLTIAREQKSVDVLVRLTGTSRPLSPSTQRPILGVQTAAAEDSVRIESVTPGLPAAQAGLKVGDRIIRINGVDITGVEGLRNALGTHAPGDTVTVTYRRDGKERDAKLTLAADVVENRPPGWDKRRPTLWHEENYRLAVIPIEFADVKHNAHITPAAWNKALFSRNEYREKSATGQKVYGSVHDYYQEVSCGALRVEGHVFDSVAASKPRADYSNDSNRYALFEEVLDRLLDREGKDALKGLDGIFFVYAGNRFQTGRGGLFWPHCATFSYHGRRWAYFIGPEGADQMASISLICHEMGHMVGLPDLYAKPEVPGSVGLGVWCTMATGHGQDGKPVHLSAWCKEQLGWLKPALIDPLVKQKLILGPVENATRECYKVLIQPDGSEYLLLENRTRTGFDRDLPGEGLLIWRVVDGRPMLEASHGITGPDAAYRFLESVPYPSKANTAFTPKTTPSSKSDRPGDRPVHLTNIRRLPDGRITFFIGYEYF